MQFSDSTNAQRSMLEGIFNCLSYGVLLKDVL